MMNTNFINPSLVGLLLLVSLIVSSDTVAEQQTSVSFGGLSKSLNTDLRLTIARENQSAVIVDQDSGKATGKTRSEILASSLKTIKASQTTTLASSKSHSNYADFIIYGATSLLQHDFDRDGFYQTFSVIFDADIYSYTERQWGEVYALLYISKNGGPWQHYYTTDSFIIEGDTELDEYEVMTSFLSGYTTDYYHILIDLYQVGYNDIVASYSSDDSNALYALPLESADYDEPYEVIDVSHGGSVAIEIGLFLLLIYSLRRINSKC